MALANLFAADPALPASQSPGPFRSGVQEVCATKRPNLGGQWAGQKKSMKNTHKQFNQAKKAKTHRPPTFYDYDNPDASPRPANFPHRTFRDSDKERDPFTHSGVHFQHNMHKKVQPRQQIQNTPTFKQDTPQQNVMQKKKKKKKNNNKKQENAQSRSNSGGNGGQWHQAGPRERFPSNGRGPTKMNKDHMQNSSAKRVRPMTQEFKDQNACEVNGRLICKHFLMGRCTKGDECQLPHANAVNNQIKSVCKFYVQGCCGKGENCPYMHHILFLLYGFK